MTLRDPHPWARAYCATCRRPHSLKPDECGCLCRSCCSHWNGRPATKMDRSYALPADRKACENFADRYHRE